jgi:protein SCO1/2
MVIESRRDLLRILAAIGALPVVASCGRKSAAAAVKFEYTDITGLGIGSDFRLIDHHGRQRTLADFRGKVVAIFFGYTHCPDMCPTALAELAQALKQLGRESDGVQVLFITVDPERDTQKVLAQYTPAFEPRFLGLYGDASTISAIAASFKVFFAAQRPNASGNYTVDHTAAVYLIDRRGRPRLYVGGGRTVSGMVHDIKLLLDE